MIDLKSVSRIDIETINNCNAKCPLCLRGTGMRTNDTLDWDLIKNNIPGYVWDTVKDINFNGTTGDNLMHPDIDDIVSWCADNSAANINVHTNGSIRSTQWWEQFGARLQSVPHKVVFGIDGLADTHATYRIGTDWDKIISNAQAFIHGGGTAYWQFILFEHNHHQVEECRKLATELGFKQFYVMYQDRFDSTHKLETNQVVLQRFNGDLTPFKDHLIINPTSNHISTKSSRNIDCYSKKINWFSIYADGTVWPCCWLMGWHKSQHQSQFPVVDYHFKNILKLDFSQISLYNNKLEDIVAGEIWQTRYTESFASKPNPICIQQCSK